MSYILCIQLFRLQRIDFFHANFLFAMFIIQNIRTEEGWREIEKERERERERWRDWVIVRRVCIVCFVYGGLAFCCINYLD